MDSRFNRVLLALVVVGVLVAALVGMYRYLQSVEGQLLQASQRLIPPLPSLSPTFPPVIELPLEVPTASPSPLASDSAQVKRVIDGDTIELEGGQVVRYIGVDTPETSHPVQGRECFGQEAKNKNQELVVGRVVRLERDVSETDRYGRLLRYVWVDEVLINRELIRSGFAHARSYPPDVAKQEELRQAEVEAQAHNLGLWAACHSL